MDDAFFRQVVACLDKNHVNFWVDSGTLLGLVRAGKPIEWDTDFDLGVWDHEVREQSIFDAFDSRYYRVESLFPHGINSICIFSANGKNEDKVDVTFYTKVGSRALHQTFLPPPGNYTELLLSANRFLNPGIRAQQKYKLVLERIFHQAFKPLLPRPLKRLLLSLFNFLIRCNNAKGKRLTYDFPAGCFESFQSVSFLGTNVNIPQAVESYLEAAYGPDWKIPKQWKNWYEGATYIDAPTEGANFRGQSSW